MRKVWEKCDSLWFIVIQLLRSWCHLPFSEFFWVYMMNTGTDLESISRVDSAEACASFGWNKECLRQCWLCKFGSRWVGGLKISRNLKLRIWDGHRLLKHLLGTWICGTWRQILVGYPDVGNHQLGLSQQGRPLKAIWSRRERYAQRFWEYRKLALRSEKTGPKFNSKYQSNRTTNGLWPVGDTSQAARELWHLKGLLVCVLQRLETFVWIWMWLLWFTWRMVMVPHESSWFW